MVLNTDRFGEIVVDAEGKDYYISLPGIFRLFENYKRYILLHVRKIVFF